MQTSPYAFIFDQMRHVRAWKAARAVHLSPSSDCAIPMMAVASKYRNVFSVAKVSHKRSQSNVRAIVVLTTTTSVSTFLSIFFSAHVVLHARHVQTFLCVPPHVYIRLALQYHMVWMTTNSHHVR